MKLSLLLTLAVVGLVAAASLVAADDATCKLTGLKLTNKATGLALDIRDSLWNTFATSTKYTFYCTCEDVSAVTVTLKSDEDELTYGMAFTPGDSTTAKPTVYLSLQTASSPLNFAVGINKIEILPSCEACSAKYVVYCTKPPNGGGVVGDPQFTGLRGQDYQVHGVSGEVYNIITDEHLQMNSKFVFLDGGSCPMFDGVKAQGCWSHAGSYLGEIGIKTSSGDRLKLVSGDYRTGFKSVELNGVQMKLDQTATLPCPDGDQSGSITFNTSYIVTVRAGNYLLEFENSDMFINQNVHVIDWKSLKSHGLLGQTWRKATYKNAIKYVEGVVDDYAVKGKNLFGDEFAFNLYQDKSATPAAPSSETPSDVGYGRHGHGRAPRDHDRRHRGGAAAAAQQADVTVTVEPIAVAAETEGETVVEAANSTPMVESSKELVIELANEPKPESRLKLRRRRNPRVAKQLKE